MNIPASLYGQERRVYRVSMEKRTRELKRRSEKEALSCHSLPRDTDVFLGMPSNLNGYVIYASADWGQEGLLADMSPRTDEETSLLLNFLPSWCLVAIHDPHPNPGKVPRVPESLGSRAEEGPCNISAQLAFAMGGHSSLPGKITC